MITNECIKEDVKMLQIRRVCCCCYGGQAGARRHWEVAMVVYISTEQYSIPSDASLLNTAESGCYVLQYLHSRDPIKPKCRG